MNNFNIPIIIFIIGPTCSNKSSLANLLSNFFPIEIISVDSTHVYKYMNIGTNKPTTLDQKYIPHHLLNILDPSESYSIYKFFFDVLYLINQIFERKAIPVLVGGSMLYYHTLINGIYLLPQKNQALRNTFYKKYYKYGSNPIYKYLKNNKTILVSHENLHPNDIKRLIRAIEIKLLLKNHNVNNNNNINEIIKFPYYNIIKFSILPINKHILKKKIKFRFYKMLEQGLEQEVKLLFKRNDLNTSLPSINSIGYRQMWDYLDNKISFEQMINKSIIATNRLLKHQYTWLNKWTKIYNDIIWLHDININKNLSIIINYLKFNHLLA